MWNAGRTEGGGGGGRAGPGSVQPGLGPAARAGLTEKEEGRGPGLLAPRPQPRPSLQPAALYPPVQSRDRPPTRLGRLCGGQSAVAVMPPRTPRLVFLVPPPGDSSVWCPEGRGAKPAPGVLGGGEPQ